MVELTGIERSWAKQVLTVVVVGAVLAALTVVGNSPALGRHRKARFRAAALNTSDCV